MTTLDPTAVQSYFVAAADAGFDAAFKGPYSTTGQRDKDANGVADPTQTLYTGEVLTPEELRRMCWFSAGTYELNNYTTINDAALIPAMVPYGVTVAGQTTTMNQGSSDGGVSPDMTKYGDVISFVKKYGGDPATLMNCALN